MEPYLGQIMMFAGTFAPRGWALCNGQILPIAQNTALFSLLGTTYGGDGVTTFALPDLRGRAPIHPGMGPGLSPRSPGEHGGSEANTLVQSQLPPHTHGLMGTNQEGTANMPEGAVLGGIALGNAPAKLYANVEPNTQLRATAIGTTGAGQPVNNMPPFLAINYVIALEGVYPTRD